MSETNGVQPSEVPPGGTLARWGISPGRATAIAGLLVVALLAVAGVQIGRHVTRPEVPAVIGVSADDARARADGEGLTLVVDDSACTDVPDGLCQVASQEPGASTRVARHSNVSVVLAPVDVEVPDTSGQTYDEAADAVDGAGLQPRKITQADTAEAADIVNQHDDDTGSWLVTRQEPAAGAKIAAGSPVALTLQAPKVKVVDVVGKDLADAKKHLASAGLLGVGSDGLDLGTLTVTGQEPRGGVEAPFASEVSLHLGTVVPKIDADDDVDDIKSQLKKVGLRAAVKPSKADWDWQLVGVSPKPGTKVAAGSKVTLTYEAPVIEFSVTGNGSRALVTWIPPDSYSIAQDTNASVPWTKVFPTDGYQTTYGSDFGNLSAQAMNGTSITCTLKVAGKVVDKQTSTGAYAVVSCSS